LNLIRDFAGWQRNDYDALTVALAKLRLLFAKRAQLIGSANGPQPLFLREENKTMATSEDNMNLGELFELIQKFLDHPNEGITY
jgi:hypothetical protein